MLEIGAQQLALEIEAGRISVVEATNAYLDHIEKNDRHYNTFLALDRERALKRASEVQEQIKAGVLASPLAGVPTALMDNISTKGMATTCASKMLGNYEPAFNASVVDKLEEAGMVILGKLNMDEFGVGSPGAFGPVRNPWDTSRSAGSGSTGAAAAVAFGGSPLSVGTDTTGSLRQSSAYCGVSCIKPTYGLVSRYGIVASASLDQAGAVGRSILDASCLLSIISGPDQKDGTCVASEPLELAQNFDGRLDGLVIGLATNCLPGKVSAEVKAAVLEAAKQLEEAGAVVEPFEMPYTDLAAAAGYVISAAEAGSGLSKYDGLKYGFRSKTATNLDELYRESRSEGFGYEVKESIILSTLLLSSEYYDRYFAKALQARTLVKDAVDNLLARFDIILSPVANTTATHLGETRTIEADAFTVAANLAGLPAVSLPCGFGEGNLPIGLQLMAKPFADQLIIKAANAYQMRTSYHTQRPEVSS
ncbi:MAG: aspartyl/glutamyl-tRNA amidotransferase subunit A [Eubacteriaceae bacterium]|nr:aspartyl/glutamyl-tRNA amidotransferase subunit A [Eubacteriaceae bacterium]